MTDAPQFEAFVREYQNMVYATAFRLLGNASDAEDAAQTVFLKAFERFDTLGSSPTASGWLKTVTTNHCLTHLTRHRRRWRLFSEMGRDDEDGQETAYEDGIASREENPAAELERADRERVLETALVGLPDHQRIPLVLFHFEERSYEDIASLLEVSLAKVKTDIHRGRETLRRRLAIAAS